MCRNEEGTLQCIRLVVLLINFAYSDQQELFPFLPGETKDGIEGALFGLSTSEGFATKMYVRICGLLLDITLVQKEQLQILSP